VHLDPIHQVYVASDNATEPGVMRSLLPADAVVVTKESFDDLMTESFDKVRG
jgi:hypothetical protein